MKGIGDNRVKSTRGFSNMNSYKHRDDCHPPIGVITEFLLEDVIKPLAANHGVKLSDVPRLGPVPLSDHYTASFCAQPGWSANREGEAQ